MPPATRQNRPTSAIDAIPGSTSPLELLALLRDARRFFHERFELHGAVFKSRFAYKVVFVIGTEANELVMISRRDDYSYRLGYGQLALGRVFNHSIMLLDGAEHRRTREILTPAVGRLALSDSAERVSEIWQGAVDRAASGGSHDVYRLSQRTTFDVAANALTGLDLGEDVERFRPHFEKLIDGTLAATPYRVPFGTLDRALRARERLFEMMRPRVEQARRREPAGLVGQLAHHRDERGQALPTDAVTAHLLMLFWAAYDTTASSASWVMHVLAERPEWQERLREERRRVLGSDPITPETGNKLNQQTWFLREVERLYPSVLFFPRVSLADVEFKGFRIPEGTPTYYSPYMTHRDPGAFQNPNAFDPDRWDPDRKTGARASALVGFGGGPRVCLGKAFAQLQLRLMLDGLLARHRIEPDPSSRPTIQALPVHHPNGYRVFVRPLATSSARSVTHAHAHL